MNWLQFDQHIQLIILLAADARLFMPAPNSLYISTSPYSKKGNLPVTLISMLRVAFIFRSFGVFYC